MFNHGVIKKIIIGLIKDLPLSLLIKFSDGRLTTQEIMELSREVAMVVFNVLSEEYGDNETINKDNISIG